MTAATPTKPYRQQIALAFLLFASLFIGVTSLPQGPFVLVVMDPRSSSASMVDIIGKADGVLVTMGSWSWLAVAYSETADFPARLRRAGAIFVLNHRLAVGCTAGA